MPTTPQYIAWLLLQELSGNLSPADQQLLDNWKQASPDNQRLYELLQHPDFTEMEMQAYNAAIDFAGQLEVPVLRQEPQEMATAAHRLYFLRRWWWAAAVIVLIGASAYLYNLNKPGGQGFVKKSDLHPSELFPGQQKAILKLADGRTITLDSVANGNIAQQGGAEIIKLDNGEIRYNLNSVLKSDAMINTMSTPRGGQYKLILPDGTKLWLNAASSITYPTAFVGSERKIKVTGEVYLEVAQHKSKPFIIDVGGLSSIQVLGTSFNINSYADDGAIKTTLIDGSVKVDQSIILKPGQQAVQTIIPGNNKNKIIVQSANIEQALAWKNGVFDFTGTSFQSVMKDVERWYDIEVKYESRIPAFKLRGKMDRGVTLADLMRFLKDYNLNIRLTGRTLIIK